MYAKYFGLAELPFRITPDPRFLWYSDQHQAAKEKILYHISQSVGPIYLLADVGTGKTTLAKRIVEELSATLAAEYDVSPERCQAEVLRFVGELSALDLLDALGDG